MWILLLACDVGPGTFRDRQNAAACANSETCAPETFAIEYGSVGDCVDTLRESYDRLYTCEIETCAFDADDAAACLDNLSDATCDEVATGDAWTRCDSVFTDCDEDAWERCMAG